MKVSANKVAQKLQMTSSGFTLIELMVTIAVLAIIVGIAAPSISTQLANQRVKSTTATLANALKEAQKYLEDCLNTIEMDMAEDFIVIDIRSAWEKLGEITGDTVDEDIIDQIFSQFCIGK